MTDDDLPAEFTMIARYLRPLAGRGALGLLDDAAVVDVPPGRSLVIAADALVAGVHFLPDDRPDLIACKLLRTNLSDLAAMGAQPLAYLTTVAVPQGTSDAWFADFAAGLAADQAAFGLFLLGGDTTSTSGPLSLSLTILGLVERGRLLLRSGAGPGDGLYVSGTIGDAALGLLAVRGEIADTTGFLADRYRVPRPRIDLGRALVGIASAAMDISDGLVQDVAHLCRASGVGAVIEADLVPLSAAAREAGRLDLCLSGGDDYELAFSVPRASEAVLADAITSTGVPVTRIGRFTPGAPRVVVVRADGSQMSLARSGWDHLRR